MIKTFFSDLILLAQADPFDQLFKEVSGSHPVRGLLLPLWVIVFGVLVIAFVSVLRYLAERKRWSQ